MSEKDIKINIEAVANAIASQRLEGLEPDKEAMDDLYRAARGELTIEQVLDNYRNRVFKK